MADQIVQELGFDAGAAIQTINSLNNALGNLNKSFRKLANTAKSFNQQNLAKSFQNIKNTNPAKTLENAAQAADKLGTKAKKAGDDGTDATKKLKNQTNELTLSWKTFIRIIQAQTIVRAINIISKGIREAVTESRELGKRIAEIQTIAGGQLGTSEQIKESLNVTSQTFGFDVLDVAESKYQELSNQVDGSTESLEFQNAASKLATITNTDLSDSVSLLSSVLNAFDLNASQSNETAGLLFKTIQQGRIRANELSDTLGRVAPLANTLGVEFNEVGGALARITQGGTRADTAITQLLGILNKLSKAGPDLQQAFEQLEVSTASEGIQRSGGLLPFLQRLQKVAGDNEGLVEFFNNVRAIQGVLSLLGTDAEKTGKVFEELGISSSDAAALLDEMFNVVSDIDARELDKQQQDLNKSFRDLADNIIPALVKGLNFLNDTINIIRDNPVVSGVIIAAGAAAFVGFGAQAVIAAEGVAGLALALKGLALATGPIGIALVGFTTAILAINAAIQRQKELGFEDLTQRYSAILLETTNDINRFKDALRLQNDEFKEANKSAQAFLNRFSEIESAAKKTVKELDRVQASTITSALDNLLESRRAVSKEIQKAVTDADKQLEKSAERQANFRAEKDSFLLDRQLDNLNEIQQVFKLVEASRDKAFDAKDLIQGTGDLDAFDSAATLLERRLSLAQRALSTAQGTGNRAAIVKAEQEVVTALNDQINLEKRRSDIIEQRRKAAEAEAAAEAAATERIKNISGDIQKELSILRSGAVLNPAQFEAAQKRIFELTDELRKQALTGDQIDLAEFLGIQDLASQAELASNNTVRTILDLRNKLPSAVEAAFADVKKAVPDDLFQLALDLGIAADSPNRILEIAKAFTEATKESAKLSAESAKFNAAQNVVIQRSRQFQALFGTATGPPEFFASLNKGLLNLINNTELTEDQVNEFFDALQKRAGPDDPRNEIQLSANLPDATVIENAKRGLNDVRTAQKNLAKVFEETADPRARKAALDAFLKAFIAFQGTTETTLDVIGGVDEKTGKIKDNTADTLTAVRKIPGAWKPVTEAIDAATDAIGRYVAAVNAAPAPPAGAGVSSMFGGFRGPLFRAFGGAARGTDIIPAMLSPGEFVMNAKSSRRFASQLIAMNSGINPVHRQEGGPVTNSFTVGDININGVTDPNKAGRSVVSELRREFRRRTSPTQF